MARGPGPLTPQQERLLGAIRAAGGGMTTPELIRLHIYVNGSSTINAVRRLETRGLVTRAARAPVTGATLWVATFLP